LIVSLFFVVEPSGSAAAAKVQDGVAFSAVRRTRKVTAK